MKKIVSVFALFMLLSASCEKEETTFPVYLYAPIIHGYFQTDDFGNTIKLIGSNDLKLSDPRLININPANPDDYVKVNSFPNPCIDVTNLSIGGDGILKKIWIVPARATDVLSYYMNANCLAVQGNPVFTLETIAPLLVIDLSQFDYTYYRVFVKINDVLLWNNIVKQ